MTYVHRLSGVTLLLMLVACSAQQVQVSQAMARSAGDEGVYVLEDAVTVKAKRTAPITLKAGTRWSPIGSIEQGRIYDTDDQVVIVNSFDVHEASIVVSEETIVGYYLTVEETFVETKPVKITLIGDSQR